MSTSVSEEASVSSVNNNMRGEFSLGVQLSTLSTITALSQQEPMKKRNRPGNPDPDAEVIALSPRTLMATNRFVCEICNKGFQREQNLQLHRRGHNLPWKLRLRSSTASETMRKRVFVCPEPSCVHHDPSRALGDLTGIKKHFCRKHGEKKWKCEKCSKRYAVQSDWKAHSKICGTKEYRCDCGTLFSRKDSFITHRAFCDALAEESARLSAPLNHLPSPSLPPISDYTPQHSLLPSTLQATLFPNWNTDPKHQEQDTKTNPPPSLFTNQTITQPSPFVSDTSFGGTLPFPPQMSATALLQKAAEMSATISGNQNNNLLSSIDQVGATASLSNHLSTQLFSVGDLRNIRDIASLSNINQSSNLLSSWVFARKDRDGSVDLDELQLSNSRIVEERIAEMERVLEGGGRGGSLGEVVGSVQISSVGEEKNSVGENKEEYCKSQFTRDFLGVEICDDAGYGSRHNYNSLRSPAVAALSFSSAASHSRDS